MSATSDTEDDGFERRVRRRAAAKAHPLDTIPVDPAHQPRGLIANTPLSVSFISFLLGSLFSFGILLFITNGYGLYWWSTYQLGFFFAVWSTFHWAEFAVTAGWNRDKCSVDCEYFRHMQLAVNEWLSLAFLLENGAMYHGAHAVALSEYLLTLYFKPEYKQWPHVSFLGMPHA